MSVSSGFSHQSFDNQFDIRPRIAVIGVGGAGGNAVNNMIRLKLEGVDFYAANTDAQALHQSMVLMENRIQLGMGVTQGLGAGSKPDVGRASAEESIDDVLRHIEGNNMLFVTAGMGGGTGTGAAPVIARAARERGILTVGVVTKPFQFEGTKRMRAAEMGIEELQMHVDTLIVIPNQNLFRVSNEATTFADAFKMADDVLYSGVRSVTDLMLMPGLINLDFADVRTVMEAKGKAMMGTGEEEGENRASKAAANAIANPLLEDVSLSTSQAVLISISGGIDMTLHEVDEAANIIRQNVQPESQIIFGAVYDEKLTKRFRVSIIATGIGEEGTVHSGLKSYHQSPPNQDIKQNDLAFAKNQSSNAYGQSSYFSSGAGNSGYASNHGPYNEEPSKNYYAPSAQEHQGSQGASHYHSVDPSINNVPTDYQASSSAFHTSQNPYENQEKEGGISTVNNESNKQQDNNNFSSTPRKKSQSILNRFAAGITGRNKVEEEHTTHDGSRNNKQQNQGSSPNHLGTKNFDDHGDNSLDIPAFLRRNN